MDSEKLALAERPFEIYEHGESPDGVYILKHAIRRRLSLLDPAWTLEPPQILETTPQIIVMRGGLTVCGVTRYGVGTGIIQPADKPFLQLKFIAKAYKSAASDILPRAALEFGVGWYMRLPDAAKVKNKAQLGDFLRKLAQPQQPAAPQLTVISGRWTHEEQKAWWQAMVNDGLTSADLLAALNVSRLSDWPASATAATEAVEAYVAKQLRETSEGVI